jgi:hypothetical protein
VIVVLGLAAVTAGVFGLFGMWWGLILGGTLSIAAALILIDVDEPKRERSVKR